MKATLHQLDILRRRRRAAGRAFEAAAAAERPIPQAAPPRFGAAKIVSNTGGGGYTVAEQWWVASGPGAWADATEPLGYVQAAARDYRNRDTGAAGETVPFWEQRACGGALEVLIDVAATEGEARETVTQHAGVALAVAKWYDIADEGTGTVTLSGADWRGRLLAYNAAWQAEPISRPLAGTEDGTFALDGLAGAKTTIVSKNINGDLVDLYVDGTDGGKLKIDLTDNGNDGHFAFLVQATDDIEPAGS